MSVPQLKTGATYPTGNCCHSAPSFSPYLIADYFCDQASCVSPFSKVTSTSSGVLAVSSTLRR